ncbi:MAG: 4-hydroxy-tetrahydrodipicolinate reductase, partial [Acidimicrobiales bacterium]
MSDGRVAVLGAGGRMGSAVCAAVASDADLELVAAVDPRHAGEDVAGVVIAEDVHQVDADRVDVAIDFTAAPAVRTNLEWCASAGLHAVLGT